MNYTLICDGAYSSSKNEGSIGIVFLRNDELILEYSNSYKNTTNNKMELAAVIIGLKMIKNYINSLKIVSDSMYVIGGASKGWKRNKNINLWKQFDIEFNRVKNLCDDIEFIHVKGHQKGDNLDKYAKWNNYVDELARNSNNYNLK